MANDAFVAFWTGAGCGLVFGIMFSAVFAAMAMRVERTEKKNVIDEVFEKYYDKSLGGQIMTKSNYFDQNGNYINIENLSLKQIYERAFDEGYKKGYIDGALQPTRMEKKTELSDADEAMRDAETDSKYLGDNEDTIAGRWHS